MKQVTFHLQRTSEASAPAERAVWGDAGSGQLLLLRARGHIHHRSARLHTSGGGANFRLVMYEHGPAVEPNGQLAASGALHIERAWAAVAFVPGSSSRLFFALEHSTQLMCVELPLAEPAVAQVPVIPVAIALYQSSICALECS
ncbi:hypothetical protein T492DRAFT_867564, partial [Pavlovales sp. CCMP2436]